jgi:hypothetical protein
LQGGFLYLPVWRKTEDATYGVLLPRILVRTEVIAPGIGDAVE